MWKIVDSGNVSKGILLFFFLKFSKLNWRFFENQNTNTSDWFNKIPNLLLFPEHFYVDTKSKSTNGLGTLSSKK
jgi:hypothetical protein